MRTLIVYDCSISPACSFLLHCCQPRPLSPPAAQAASWQLSSPMLTSHPSAPTAVTLTSGGQGWIASLEEMLPTPMQLMWSRLYYFCPCLSVCLSVFLMTLLSLRVSVWVERMKWLEQTCMIFLPSNTISSKGKVYYTFSFPPSQLCSCHRFTRNVLFLTLWTLCTFMFFSMFLIFKIVYFEVFAIIQLLCSFALMCPS